MESNQDILANEWQVDEEVTGYMYQSSVLAKYVAVLGMCFAVLTTLKTLTSLIKLAMAYRQFFYNFSFLLSLAAAVLAGVLYFAISLLTYRFAVKLQHAVRQTDQAAFRMAWQHFKFCYRMKGIMFIVYLAFMLLLLIF